MEIGVTLHHPHGQIYAFPFVTPRVRQHGDPGPLPTRLQSGQNLFEDLVAAELDEGTRIVARNEHWVAFVPPAARWPYEVRCSRCAGCRTWPPWTTEPGTRSAASTSTCCGGSTGCSARRAPVHLGLAPGAGHGR